MTDENLVRALYAFTRRRPFVPFLIQLMSGEMIRIAHPEAIRPRGTTCSRSSASMALPRIA